MYDILKKTELAPNIKMIKVLAPEISRKAMAGQFVIIRVDDKGERIPLTIVKRKPSEGTITLIFQEVGVSTMKLGVLTCGDKILNLAGPLGNPSKIKNFGLVAITCGGIGTVASYPIARALKEAGNKIISIIGARNKESLILENELKEVSDEIYISTDDGSKGYKGFVSDLLKILIERGYNFNLVYAIGPILMMSAITKVTKPFFIKTIVSLNPLMMDGIGMCGACRVTIDRQTKFTCIDGPEFDGHLVDFEELVRRQKIYTDEEKKAKIIYQKRERL